MIVKIENFNYQNKILLWLNRDLQTLFRVKYNFVF